MDTGEYNPVLGNSYSEIAGMSRSQHRSQGMGVAASAEGPRKTSYGGGGDAGHDGSVRRRGYDLESRAGRRGGRADPAEAGATFAPEHPRRRFRCC